MQINAGLMSGLQGLLRADGKLDRVNAHLQKRGIKLQELDERATHWLPAGQYDALLSAIGELWGTTTLRELGRTRCHQTMDAGPLGAILRTWLRTYGERSSTIAHLFPYVWDAGVRDGGKVRILREFDVEGERHAILEIVAPSDIFVASDAWHRFLEGFSLGLFDLFQVSGEVAFKVQRSDVVNAVTIHYQYQGLPQNQPVSIGPLRRALESAS